MNGSVETGWELAAGNWKLTSLLNERDGLLFGLHDLTRNHALPDLLLPGERVHQVEHEVLDDHPQAARADLAQQGGFRDRLERVVCEPQLDVLVFEQLLVLTRDGVPWLRENLHQRGAIELVEGADHRQPTDELRNQAVFDEVFRLHHLERGPDVAAGEGLHGRVESQRLLADPPVDLLVEPDEGPTADEQDVGGIDLEELLMGMLAAPLGRYVGDRPFENLEQGLLDPLARDVAGDRGIFVLPADLVDLVDIDDPLLALLDIAARRLQQFEDDVLDVLADIPGLGQGRRIDDREGDG